MTYCIAPYMEIQYDKQCKKNDAFSKITLHEKLM